MATHYQIQLQSIRVIENGTIEHEKGTNGLAVTLYYPTPGKTSLVTTRRIELLDNVTYDYTQEDFPKQILFKEAILDSAYIVVELTSIREAAKLGLIFYKLFKDIVGKAVDVIPGGAIVTALARNVTGSLVDLIEPEDKVEIIGRAGWLISETIGSVELPLQLKVPKAIALSRISVDRAGNTIYTKRNIPQDFVNAQVTLTIKKI